MNKTVTIKNNFTILPEVEEYLNPDYIYFPLDENVKIIPEIGDTIYKEDPVLKFGEKTIFSPVSGKIIGKINTLVINNQTTPCLAIENDFREKIKNKKGCVKYINEYSQTELYDIISTYCPFLAEINYAKKNIIINGIDSDPFEKTYSTIINKYCSKLLETIDAIVTTFNISTTIFTISNHDSNNVTNLTNNIGTYPNIKLKLISESYPISKEELLAPTVLNKKQLAEGYIFLNIDDILNLYNALKRRRPIIEKYITISGDAIETGKVIKTKIGVSLNDIIKNCCNIKSQKYHIVKNGLLAGTTLLTANTPLTNDIDSIFLNSECSTSEKKCINCGLCNEKCPVGLNPKYIKEHKRADRSKCINCGLCTYICPSKINFKPFLGGKNE